MGGVVPCNGPAGQAGNWVYGILGFIMEKTGLPLPPLILGLILGPMIEDNLRVGLVKTDGSFWPFLARPISLSLAVLLALVFLGEYIMRFVRLFIKKPVPTDDPAN